MRHYLRTPADTSDGLAVNSGATVQLTFTYEGETTRFDPGAFGVRTDGLFEPDIALHPSEEGQRHRASARAAANVYTEMDTSSRDTKKVLAQYSGRADYPTDSAATISTNVMNDDGLDENFGPASAFDLAGYDYSYGSPAYTLSDGETLSVYVSTGGQAAFFRCHEYSDCPTGQVVVDATSTTRFGLSLPDGVTAVDGLTGETLAWNATALAPVPLPAAAWLLLAGMGTLGIASRKKRG